MVILDKRGKKLHGIEKSDCNFRDFSNVVADEDNMYVTDRGGKKKLIFKFNKNCELLNVVGGLADIDPVAVTACSWSSGCSAGILTFSPEMLSSSGRLTVSDLNSDQVQLF